MQDNGPQNVNALTKALARGTAINLTGFAARAVLVFLHSLLAARLYGAEAYGVYSIGIAAVSLLSFVGQLGLDRTITRFVALYHARNEPQNIVGTLKLGLCISMSVAIGIGLVLSIGAEPMARLFGEPALVSSFHILGFAVPALTLGMLLAAFTQGFKRMRYKVIALDIVSPGVELLGLVVLAWLGVWQLGLPIAYMFSVVLSCALLIYYAKLDLRKLGRAFPNSAGVPPAILLKPVLSFAVPVLAINILVSVTQRSNILMLGAMGTSAMVGVFNVVQRLAALGRTFLISTNFTLVPMIGDLVERRQIEELSRLYKISTRWLLVSSLPFFLTIGFFGAEILQMFGREFASGSGALWYLIAAMIFSVSTGSCNVVLLMSDHPRHSAINEAIMLITVVGLNLLLIPRHGLLGTVWALAVGIVIVNTLQVTQVWWHLRIHPYSWSLLKVAVASVTMSGVLWAWRAYTLSGNSAWYLLVLGGGAALLAYGLVLIALGLEDNEVEMLRTLQKRLVPTQVSST